MTKRLYISQKNTYQRAVVTNYFSDRELVVQEVDFGIVIPNKKANGGIYDSQNLKLVSTLLARTDKQEVDMDRTLKLEHSGESVIFGGRYCPDFGHLLLEELSRLWYIAKNPQDTRKIIFTDNGSFNKKTIVKERFFEFLRLLNIELDRIIIIDNPTKFAHITIPEASYFLWQNYTKEYPQIYRHFAAGANQMCVKQQTFDKIYLSHAKWGHRAEQCFLNEQIYEEFFRNRGYEIIYPEECSVTKIAYLMNNAKEVATTMGSTAHLALFCKKNTRFIILTRECNTTPALIPQCLINQAMKLDWFIINANHNYLPSFDQGTGWGVVNFAFTDDFKEFCKDYFKEDFEKEFLQKSDDLAYFRAWTAFYSKPEYFKCILSNLTAFDFINKMSEVFFKVTLDKNAFVENALNTPTKKRKEKWYKRFLGHLRTMKF